MFKKSEKVKRADSPELRVGRAMLGQIMSERNCDAESAAAVYGEEGLPKTDELVAARAAAELTALAEQKNAAGENGKGYVDGLLSDERFVELIRDMPLRLALGVYERYVVKEAPEENKAALESDAPEADMDGEAESRESARIDALMQRAREEGARDVLEKLKANSFAIKPLKGESAALGIMERDYRDMSSKEFNELKRRLRSGV